MKTVFCSGKILLLDCIVEEQFLVVEDGVISGVYEKMPEDFDVKYDLHGAYIAP